MLDPDRRTRASAAQLVGELEMFADGHRTSPLTHAEARMLESTEVQRQRIIDEPLSYELGDSGWPSVLLSTEERAEALEDEVLELKRRLRERDSELLAMRIELEKTQSS